MKSYKLIRALASTILCMAGYAAATSAAVNASVSTVQVVIVPFVVEPQPFSGAPERPDQTKELQHLSDEATKQAIQSLQTQHVANVVTRVASVEDGAGKIVISGTIRMPISLPSDVGGWNASHRKGHFATATVTVSDATGKVIDTKDITLNWDAVRWFRIGKTARNFPLDQVLDGFARKAADQSVRRLNRQSIASR